MLGSSGWKFLMLANAVLALSIAIPARAEEAFRFPKLNEDDYPWSGELSRLWGSDDRIPVFAGPSVQSRKLWIVPRQRWGLRIVGVSNGWGIFFRMFNVNNYDFNDMSPNDFKGQYGWVQVNAEDIDQSGCEQFRDQSVKDRYEYKSQMFIDEYNKKIGDEASFEDPFCLRDLNNVKGTSVIVLHYMREREGSFGDKSGPTNLANCIDRCHEDARCVMLNYNTKSSTCEIVGAAAASKPNESGAEGSEEYIVGVKLSH